MLNGNQIIKTICKKIQYDKKLCYDSTIIEYLRNLSEREVTQLFNFHDISIWRNERINKYANQLEPQPKGE